MIYLISAGLVALLGLLLLVRSAQQVGPSSSDRPRDEMDAEAEAEASPPLGSKYQRTLPPPQEFGIAAIEDSIARDEYLWESRRVARRGESRAGNLDFFGYLVSGLAGLIVLTTLLAVVNTEDTLTADERVVIVLGACGSVLALVAIAAMFFGFGALVRNTSRSLAIAAGTAIDRLDAADQRAD